MTKAIEIVNTVETTRRQLEAMSVHDTVDAVCAKCGKKEETGHQKTFMCKKCGTKHAEKKLTTFRELCLYCKKPNHFAKYCFKRKAKNRQQAELHDVEEEETEVDGITCGTDQSNTAYANVSLSTGDNVRFKIVAGAQVNMIPITVYNKLRKRPVIKNVQNQQFFGYAGQQIDIRGYIELSCEYKEKNSVESSTLPTPRITHSQF